MEKQVDEIDTIEIEIEEEDFAAQGESYFAAEG